MNLFDGVYVAPIIGDPTLGKRPADRLLLHHLHNRLHDGEFGLCYQCQSPGSTHYLQFLFKVFNYEPFELSYGPPDEEYFLVGEVDTQVVGDRLVDKIVPLREINADDIERGQRMARAHREFRRRSWAGYPLEERLADLKGMKS